MRYLIFLVFLSGVSVETFGQTDRPMTITVSPNATSVSAPDLFAMQTFPSFPGGDTALVNFIRRNMQYPALAKEYNIQGKVVLSLIINIDGKISNITVLKDIGGGCGQEAARIIGLMPAWIPGSYNGKPVKVMYTLPVKFELPE
jgi:periplasmic protein TonB